VSVISSERKTLLTNFFSLSLIQATNYILPLLVFPYLVKVLGIVNFGIVSFAQTFALYLAVITDYGFNLSATREVALQKNSITSLNIIYSEVMSTKIFLLVLSFLILAVLILLIPSFREESLVYITSFSIVIGQTLSPVWFFQGMEQMKYITFLNVLSKGLFTISVFVLVKHPEDYWLANLLQGIGGVVAGVLSQWFVIKNFNIKIQFVSFQMINKQLKESWHIFISNFAIMACFSNNIFILGLFADKLSVGYYSIAEKIILAIRQILVMFSQAIYPFICRLTVQNHQEVRSFLYKTSFPMVVFMLILSSSLYLFSNQIIWLIFQRDVPEIAFLLKFMSFIPFIASVNVPANQVLLAYNFNKSYTRVMLSASILNLILNFLLTILLKAIGSAITITVTELYIAISLHLFLHIKHPPYSLFYNQRVN
jgi:PST family polysaccharide transporter